MSLVTLRTMPGMKIECTHNESGAKFTAATPKMYNGSGDSFSGTDLCATSLGVCAATIMSVHARDNGLDIVGMTVDVDKEMNATPRSIGGVRLVFNMPDKGYDAMQKQELEESIRTCPVCLTLKGVVQDISFRW